MEIAFILAVAAAVVFMVLFLVKRPRKEDVEKNVAPAPIEIQPGFGTPLSLDLVIKALKFNGIDRYQNVGDGWLAFALNGHTYHVSVDNIPFITFFIAYEIQGKECYERYNKAIDQLDSLVQPQLIQHTDSDEHWSLIVRLPSVQMSFEHFCVSLLSYLRVLDDTVASVQIADEKLRREQEMVAEAENQEVQKQNLC